MTIKSIVLFATSCIIIGIIYSTDFYNTWFDTKIAVIGDQVADGINNLGLEYRYEARFGESYLTFRNAKDFIQHNIDSNKAKYGHPVILLPPDGYVKAQKSNVLVFEPVIFYYFFGMKSVWITSTNVRDANWVITMANGQTYVRFIENKSELDTILNVFKNYKVKI